MLGIFRFKQIALPIWLHSVGPISNCLHVRCHNAQTVWVTAILYYDYTLTLPIEIDWFWKRFKINWISLLYTSNRFLSLLGHIPIIIIYFSPMISENVRYFFPQKFALRLTLDSGRCRA